MGTRARRCGDGNNLKLYTKIPEYKGLDVSETVIAARKEEWAGRPSRTFALVDAEAGPPRGLVADMGMSLDVLYHVVEITLWKQYLENLCEDRLYLPI